MSETELFFQNVIDVAQNIDYKQIEWAVLELQNLRDRRGRLFIIGVGGSAGNASHMVNDMRKLCEIEAYAPSDNVSEITARTNDEGFDTIFSEYLRVSKFCFNDTLFILSVGGGNKEKNVSLAIVNAIDYVKKVGGYIISILGRSDGYAAEKSDIVIGVPLINTHHVTPLSISFQSVVWHSMVTHSKLAKNKTKW